MSTLLVKVKETFSFRQEGGRTVRLIVDSCQHLKKLSLGGMILSDDDVIHVINRLQKQLTTLGLFGKMLTDVAYIYLNNCAR